MEVFPSALATTSDHTLVLIVEIYSLVHKYSCDFTFNHFIQHKELAPNMQ